MLDHPLVHRVVGVVVILALLGGAVWVLERVFGDADMWGLPETGECGERLPRDSGEDDLTVVDCDDSTAEVRVVRRYDDTTDSAVCAGAPTATMVFVYDGDTRDVGDEAVFCLAEIAP